MIFICFLVCVEQLLSPSEFVRPKVTFYKDRGLFLVFGLVASATGGGRSRNPTSHARRPHNPMIGDADRFFQNAKKQPPDGQCHLVSVLEKRIPVHS